MAVIDRVVTLEEMRASRGMEQPPCVSPPISASDIRKFAIAVYWPETPPRIYWDEEYACQTKWGSIIAPPEFNPFAWMIAGRGFFPVNKMTIDGARRFRAGSEVQYEEPMRPGDIITASERVADIVEKRGRSGHLIFVVNETIWRNAAGANVKTWRASTVVILPPEVLQ